MSTQSNVNITCSDQVHYPRYLTLLLDGEAVKLNLVDPRTKTIMLVNGDDGEIWWSAAQVDPGAQLNIDLAAPLPASQAIRIPVVDAAGVRQTQLSVASKGGDNFNMTVIAESV